MIHPIIMPVVLGVDMTRRALTSCWKQDIDGGTRVIAIDNASSDGVGPWLRTQAVMSDRRLHVIAHGTRTNLHRIWNDALALCFDRLRYSHALVINNDIEMHPSLYRLLVADSTPFVTGVASSVLSEPNPASRSPHPSFSCFLMRRAVWDKVGPFDERFWVYCGDGDYHLRMDAMGIDACAVAVPFLHEVSATLKRSTKEEGDFIQAQAEQDRAAFLQKWHCTVGSPEYYAKFRHARDHRYQETGRLD